MLDLLVWSVNLQVYLNSTLSGEQATIFRFGVKSEFENFLKDESPVRIRKREN